MNFMYRLKHEFFQLFVILPVTTGAGVWPQTRVPAPPASRARLVRRTSTSVTSAPTRIDVARTASV